MVQHVGAGVVDDVEAVGVALTVRDQHFDAGAGLAITYRTNRLGDVCCAPIGQIVAGHHGDHRVIERHLVDRLGDLRGLIGIGGLWVAGIDQTEPTLASATLTQSHKGRCAIVPAVEDVRAARLFAHRHQIEALHDPFESAILRTHVGLHSHPFRLAALNLQSGSNAGLVEAAAQPNRGALEMRRGLHEWS